MLRHKPDDIDLALDPNGWASVDELIKKAAANKMVLTREDLVHIVAESDKQCFAFDEIGTRIRANQGRSIEIDIDLQVMEPPALLYHGTAVRFLDSIYKQGSQVMNRHDVHMTENQAIAIATGS
jgi:putative RNA 2'-phosphotransferase